MSAQDPLREARKAKRDLLMQYIVDSLKAEEATRAGNQRTIYGQAAFVAGWMEAAPPNIRAALPRQDEPGLREALWQCGVESGMDTDGDTGPGAIVAGMGDAGFAAAIVEHVRQLRGAYDECLAEPGLDAAWAAAEAALPEGWRMFSLNDAVTDWVATARSPERELCPCCGALQSMHNQWVHGHGPTPAAALLALAAALHPSEEGAAPLGDGE